MNCTKAERRIYLYRELTDKERKETQRHLETCASCSQIMERTTAMQAMIRSQYPEHIPMVDGPVMAARIMNTVAELQRKRSSALSCRVVADHINSPLRYAMAAVSLFLVVAFVGEYSIENKTRLPYKHYPTVPGRKTELNSASFIDAFIAARENNKGNEISLYECVVTCLNPQNPNCADCKNKFANP